MRISDWSSDVCSSDLLARDCDVVDVAFAQTRVGDAHEFGALAEILEGAAAGITHRGLHAADHLVNDVLRGALERHLALNALGNQLHLVLDILLEIAVGAAARHRADAAHAADRKSTRLNSSH